MAYLVFLNPGEPGPRVAFERVHFAERTTRVRLEGSHGPDQRVPLTRLGASVDPTLFSEPLPVDLGDLEELPENCHVIGSRGFNFVVSAVLRNLIEAEDPAAMDFVPVTLVDAKSQANLGDGWSLAVFRQRANPIKEDISELAGVFQGHGAKTLPRHVENLSLYCDASDVAGLTIWTGLPQRAFPYPGGVTPDHMALDTFTYVSDALYQSMRSAGVDDFSVAIPIIELAPGDSPTPALDSPKQAEALYAPTEATVYNVALPKVPLTTSEPSHREITRFAIGEYEPQKDTPLALDIGPDVAMESLGQAWFCGSALIVSDYIKAVLEDLESGIHRYAPIRVSASGNDLPEHAWAVRIGTRLQPPIIPALCQGISTGMLWGGVPVASGSLDWPSAKLVFDATICAACHMWVDSDQTLIEPGRIYLSAALLKAIGHPEEVTGEPREIHLRRLSGS